MSQTATKPAMKKIFKLYYELNPNPSSHTLLVYAADKEAAIAKAKKMLQKDYEAGCWELLPHSKEYSADNGESASMLGTSLMDCLSHADVSEMLHDLEATEKPLGILVKVKPSQAIDRCRKRLKELEIRNTPIPKSIHR